MRLGSIHSPLAQWHPRGSEFTPQRSPLPSGILTWTNSYELLRGRANEQADAVSQQSARSPAPGHEKQTAKKKARKHEYTPCVHLHRDGEHATTSTGNQSTIYQSMKRSEPVCLPAKPMIIFSRRKEQQQPAFSLPGCSSAAALDMFPFVSDFPRYGPFGLESTRSICSVLAYTPYYYTTAQALPHKCSGERKQKIVPMPFDLRPWEHTFSAYSFSKY